MTPQFNFIGLVTKDMAASLRFYGLLGLPVPEPGEDHVQCALPNGVNVAWDTEELIRKIDDQWEAPKGHRIGLGFQCESPAHVDEVYAKVVAAGYDGYREPWDAFWGQRYAQLMDPDGNVVDLYASLGG